MRKDVLPDFQKFLGSRGLVQEKYLSYYAYWVSRFLAFSNNNENLSRDLKIEKFITHLNKQDKITDWQIRQADDALRLYIDHFLVGDTSSILQNLSKDGKKYPDVQIILNEMRKAIRIRRYAYATERTYVNWSRRFYDYLLKIKKKDINNVAVESEDVRDYLSYLALQRRVSASTQNQAFNSILFLFRNVLKADLKDLQKTVRAKRGQRLPVVLSVNEVQKLFKHVEGQPLLVLQLLYGSGMRLMEVARLRVKDIDFSSNLIFIRNGKGDKDRATVLPESVHVLLKQHLEKVQNLHKKDLETGHGEVYLPDALGRKYPNAANEWHWQYVFPSSRLSVDPRSGKVQRFHMSGKTIQNTLKRAVKRVGIMKHVSVHALRHSFATHLLMNGVNIREIQTLMGHKSVETTMIYTHVIRDITKAPQSPLDSLYTEKN